MCPELVLDLNDAGRPAAEVAEQIGVAGQTNYDRRAGSALSRRSSGHARWTPATGRACEVLPWSR